MIRRIASITFSLSVLVSGTGSAQRIADQQSAFRAGSTREAPAAYRAPLRPLPPDGDMVIGGLLAGALLAVAGGRLGEEMTDCSDAWVCLPTEVLLGALIGETIGVPLGVNIVAGRASLPEQLALSSAVMALGLLLAPPTRGLSVLAAIPFQFAVAIDGERRAAAIRDAEPR